MADSEIGAVAPSVSSAELVIEGLKGSKTSKQASGAAFDTEAIVNQSLDAVTMSAAGKQINSMYAELGKIADPDQKDQAQQAFRTAITDQVTGSGGEETRNFLLSMQKLSENDSGTFQATFQTAATLNEGGYDTNGFLNTVTRLDGTGFQGSFVRETNNIVTNQEASEETKHDVFSNFMGSVNGIMNQGFSSEDLTSAFSGFFSEIGRTESLEDKNNFMNQFREANLGQPGSSEDSE
jgi:hypothetical protein